MASVSRPTLLRWIKNGILKEAIHRDRRGWRLFSKTDVKRIEVEANEMN